MAQSTFPSTSSSLPLPDAFSTALTGLFDSVRPAIVQIRNEQRGGGTGIVWHADGRIITNNHVVPNDNDKIQVHFTDDRTFPARVLQRNPQLDLALLQIEGSDFQALPVADSSKLRVGELVFAIGHPWGQRWAMTAGIFSTMTILKRQDGTETQYIKSDVLLAPGNSGGPLLDAAGKVVGINAMIFGGDQAVSIPSNVVTTWLAGLPRRRAILGVGVQQVELPDTLRQQVQTQQATGLLVANTHGRANFSNDLLIGDILLSVDNVALTNTGNLRTVLANKGSGDTVTISVIRAGATVSVQVVLLAQESAA
ncbi:MAG: trypsin-like peptidase domain-containing protein [Ktedonobacteraceae bacterium]